MARRPAAPPPPDSDWPRSSKIAFAVLLAFGLALRTWLCFNDDGIYWPDEIYQSLEPAHRLAFGYGLIPWEFIEGARNWAFPGLLAGVLKVSAFVLGDSPHRYVVAMRLLFTALGMTTAWGTYRLARTCDADRTSSALGAALFALAPPAIYFAPRALSESASAVAVVFGLSLALRREPRMRDVLVGSALVGFATLLRIQNGMFCVGLIGILAGRRRWRWAGVSTAMLVAWGVLYGLLDRITWGDWYHSAIAYLRFNMVEGKASQWGVAESTYYLRVLWTSMPLVTVWAAPLSLLSARRSTGLLIAALAYLAAHSLIPHKEFRFVLPFLPIWFALAASGLSWALSRIPLDPRWICGGIALFAVVAAARFHELTFDDLGLRYPHPRLSPSAYDDSGPINRLLFVAHDQPDLCGIEVEATHLAWTGGATYLHRDVPIYLQGTPAGSGHFNYVLMLGRTAGTGRVVATQGAFSLVRLPRSSCEPDPGYRWKLP